MIRQIFTIAILSTVVGVFFTSCGVSKEVVNRMSKEPMEHVDLPLDYCNLFPDSSSFEQWDKDYNSYEKFLTPDILKTQTGIASNMNGVQAWRCIPSARTHVQLDPRTRIFSKDSIIGEWRIVVNRSITYEDSASYPARKIYRSTKLNYDNMGG